jgi:hypothetical protein
MTLQERLATHTCPPGGCRHAKSVLPESAWEQCTIVELSRMVAELKAEVEELKRTK